MDEVSSYVGLDLLFVRRQGRPIDCSTSPSNPMMEGPQCRFRREARARERHQHPVVDGLKVLDPKRPIREADMKRTFREFRVGPIADSCTAAKAPLFDNLVGGSEQRRGTLRPSARA